MSKVINVAIKNKRLSVVKMMMLWWISGKMRKHRISIGDIRDNSGVAPFEIK